MTSRTAPAGGWRSKPSTSSILRRSLLPNRRRPEARHGQIAFAPTAMAIEFFALRGCLRRASTVARFGLSARLTKPNAFRQRRSLRRVVRRDHGVIGRQAPLLAILLRRQAERRQVPPQRLKLFAVLETDQILRCDGLADRNRWSLHLDLRRSAFRSLRESLHGCMHRLN